MVDRQHVIIAGHARYGAMLALGWTEAPVVVADLDPARASAYRIADNATAQWSGWDDDSLLAEIRRFDGDLEALLRDLIPDVERLAFRPGPAPEVTQEQIEAVEEELQDRFQPDQYREIACPNCGKKLYMRV